MQPVGERGDIGALPPLPPQTRQVFKNFVNKNAIKIDIFSKVGVMINADILLTLNHVMLG
jgi:hypothetical protein